MIKMYYLDKLVSGAKEYYRSVNRANMSGAIDIVVIQQPDGTFKSTPFHVRFGKSGVLVPRSNLVEIRINDKLIDNLTMRIGSNGECFFDEAFDNQQHHSPIKSPRNIGTEDLFDKQMNIEDANSKTQTFDFGPSSPSDNLTESLSIQSPINTTCSDYEWNSSTSEDQESFDSLSRSSVDDGTVEDLPSPTQLPSWASFPNLSEDVPDSYDVKSDVRGQLMPLMGLEWVHNDVVSLYHKIAANGYRFLYLSSRSVGQARSTRGMLCSLEQNGHRLPDGPILLAPFSLWRAIHKEVIQRKADEFKIACLQQVRNLFPQEAYNSTSGQFPPLVAGFGNRATDIKTYRAVGLQGSHIFTVNRLGEVVCGNDESVLATGKSRASQTSPLTYRSLTSMVNDYFPQRKVAYFRL
ncbi:hypothetical protein T265_01757 [Opisthorchis viverrini]|uniref:LNS2/PITP domain-containing protein n=1 Tax=Opisthorchis viverrini TaxID=6198 RepID=A0A075A1M5_OPIVI|nr:hypothetical protein T265_01757 [Opisthorchis viverrini]KER32137.1 hypothetical protein T265_01757 [Opisthorchis viverrini]